MKGKGYREIVRSLVRKSFPQLQGKFIFLRKGKFFGIDCFALVVYFFFFSWIFVHPKMDKLPKNQVEAVLAHELAHLYIIANKNIFEKVKFGIGWIFTKRIRRNFERDADLLAIKKVYGQGLFERVKKTEKEYNKERLVSRKEKGYLSSKEIKSIIGG